MAVQVTREQLIKKKEQLFIGIKKENKEIKKQKITKKLRYKLHSSISNICEIWRSDALLSKKKENNIFFTYNLEVWNSCCTFVPGMR